MDGIWKWVKENPIVTAISVFVFFAILIVMSGGTETEEISEEPISSGQPDYSGAVAASAALSQMTIQGQVASRISDNERAAKEADANAAVQVGKANFNYLTNKDVLSAKVAVRGFESDEATARIGSDTSIRLSDNQRLAQEASFSRDVQIASLSAAVENNKTNVNAANTAAQIQHAAALRLHELNVNQYVDVRKIDAGREVAAQKSAFNERNQALGWAGHNQVTWQ